jgi:hypothetical protein
MVGCEVEMCVGGGPVSDQERKRDEMNIDVGGRERMFSTDPRGVCQDGHTVELNESKAFWLAIRSKLDATSSASPITTV